MKPKILIGGATGTNGRSVVKTLSDQGVSLRALVRKPDEASSITAPGVELVRGDYMDIKSLENALQGIEVAFFVGSIHQDYVQWVKNYVEVAKRSGVKRVVKFSGMTASVNAKSEIIRQHGVADQYLMESGLDFTLIQPNSFYQNMLAHAKTIKEQGKFYMNMRDTKQSIVDVRDITAVIVKTLTEKGHEGKKYEITGPQALTFHEVSEELSQAVGKNITYVPISDKDVENALKSLGLPDWQAHALSEIFSYFAEGHAQKITTTVKDVAGKDPIPFSQFARDFADAFK